MKCIRAHVQVLDYICRPNPFGSTNSYAPEQISVIGILNNLIDITSETTDIV